MLLKSQNSSLLTSVEESVLNLFWPTCVIFSSSHLTRHAKNNAVPVQMYCRRYWGIPNVYFCIWGYRVAAIFILSALFVMSFNADTLCKNRRKRWITPKIIIVSKQESGQRRARPGKQTLSLLLPGTKPSNASRQQTALVMSPCYVTILPGVPLCLAREPTKCAVEAYTITPGLFFFLGIVSIDIPATFHLCAAPLGIALHRFLCVISESPPKK